MEKVDKRRVCLLDMDTTLYEGDFGYVIADLCIFLNEKQIFKFPTSDMQEVLTYMITNSNDRTIFAKELITFYYRGLKGVSFEDAAEIFGEFWETKENNGWYSHTKRLIEIMNENKYETIVISGSPKEALGKAQSILEFKKLYATKSEKQGEYFSGEWFDWNERATEYAKQWVVSVINDTQEFDKENSFAFGDSESDIPLLSAVNQKNAFFVFHTKRPLPWETEVELKKKKEKIMQRYNNKGWNFVEVGDELLKAVKERLEV